jgi:hypothetical protein
VTKLQGKIAKMHRKTSSLEEKLLDRKGEVKRLKKIKTYYNYNKAKGLHEDTAKKAPSVVRKGQGRTLSDATRGKFERPTI